MKDSGTAFSSFFQYINKVFDFRTRLAALTDARTDPVYSAAVVFQAVFYGFLFRLGSFHRLEAEIDEPFLRHWLGGGAAVSRRDVAAQLQQL